MTLTAEDPRAVESFIGIVVNYEAGSDGSPLRLLNRDHVLQSFRAVGDIPEKVHAFFENLPDEMLASIVLRVPTYASTCQDIDFSNGIAIQYDVDESGADGLSQKGTVSYSLSNANASNGLATVNYREEMTVTASGQLVKKVATADCKISMNDGWTRTVVYSLDRSSEVNKKSESWDIQFD